MDWNLRVCARKGHVTYAPDEQEYRRKLEAHTPLGEAWRCLRCGAYVLGEPHGRGPAENAPVLLRGKQLRSAFILRALAIERWIRGAIIILLGVAVLRLKSTQVSLKDLFDKDLSSLKPFFDQIHFNVSDSTTIHSIEKVLSAKPSTLNLIAGGLFFYGALQVVEGIGLWSLKRWGEYVAVVGTTLFIPFEIYELTHNATWLKALALLINVAAVLYLLLSKRLFGLRGGYRAYEESLHEASLLEVQESAEAA
ncbi:MAG: putative rane protein [Pseudonocardiales bacterium]|nr:putative rane protein [Pseudonocardiales bacterium]